MSSVASGCNDKEGFRRTSSHRPEVTLCFLSPRAVFRVSQDMEQLLPACALFSKLGALGSLVFITCFPQKKNETRVLYENHMNPWMDS